MVIGLLMKNMFIETLTSGTIQPRGNLGPMMIMLRFRLQRHTLHLQRRPFRRHMQASALKK